MAEEKTLQQLRKEVKEYIMNDTHRKEIFTDIEICCEDDNDEANRALGKIVDSYSVKDCKGFLEAMQQDCDLCYAGWVNNGSLYPASKKLG